MNDHTRCLLVLGRIARLVNVGRIVWWAMVLIFGDDWLHQVPDQPKDQTDPEPVMA